MLVELARVSRMRDETCDEATERRPTAGGATPYPSSSASSCMDNVDRNLHRALLAGS